ncbi:MAG: 4Fe-4S cluster-binding domain-containing protein [Nitrospiraceae bacterium]|nr:4Fe-4S cluster-binding domain-containing protein [Nitrospiraceae bacterium]
MNVVLYRLAYPVTSLGPGTRIVLWVAGCAQRCERCVSPEMQDAAAGKAVPVDIVLRRLLELDPQLDGITLSGGEPFDQPVALVRLLSALRDHRPAWSVMAYSGYTLNEICGDMMGRAELLNKVDILIDGPYRKDVPARQALAGSGNQRIHYLTERGRALRVAVESSPPQQLNLGLANGEGDMLIGVAGDETRKAVSDALGAVPEDEACPGEDAC